MTPLINSNSISVCLSVPFIPEKRFCRFSFKDVFGAKIVEPSVVKETTISSIQGSLRPLLDLQIKASLFHISTQHTKGIIFVGNRSKI